MVEHNPDTIEVAGSSPAMPTKKRIYSSVGLECLPYKQEAAGSNPARFTTNILDNEKSNNW